MDWVWNIYLFCEEVMKLDLFKILRIVVYGLKCILKRKKKVRV